MYKQIAILLVIAVAAQATVYMDCPAGNGHATIHRVDVEGCADGSDGRCQFVKGRFYKVQVEATSNGASAALPYSAKANILGIPVTLLEGNACDELTTGRCPVAAGTRIVFDKDIEITNTYPAIQSTLTIEVKDSANTRAVCAQLKFQILNS